MRTRILVATLMVVAAAALPGCTTKVVTAGPTADTIVVNGVGTALSKPDRASVEFGVSATDADPRKAMADVSAASAKLTAGLKAAGIAEKALQTGGVQLQPQYNYRKTPAKLTGYQASVNVVAKTENVDEVGDVIIAGTQAGATTVGGVTFDLSEDNPARYSASANAVTDARKRAEAMAKAAGRSVGQVVSMGQPEALQSSELLRYPNTHGMFAAAAPRLDIQPGQLTAGETVSVTFALK